MMTRKEKDSLGEIDVPNQVYWGAQTERSLQHFHAGNQKMHERLIACFGWVKLVAAEVNCELGVLEASKKDLIVKAAKEVIDGKLAHHFPLRVWQTGSGTHTNMNVNEVIANRAIELAGGQMGARSPIHPNDHVNCSQSSNDTFPTAMSLAAVLQLQEVLLPQIDKLISVLEEKTKQLMPYIKVGRTHLMDATPISLGQEFSAYQAQISGAKQAILQSLPTLCELAIGGTAVGTGLNVPAHFAQKVVAKLSTYLNYPFKPANNLFAAIACHDPFVLAHGALKLLATALLKIATDLSWMVAGPFCGIAELSFQANEPGSSIMAGKVNPTQCEALTMVCVQVFGNDTSIAIAGSRGNFELNVLKPLIIHNFLESTDLLADSIRLFTTHFLHTLKPNKRQLNYYLDHSLMLVTALIPKIGYDKAALVAKKAYEEHLPLKVAALSLEFVTEEEFDQLVDPKKMI